MGAPPKPSNYFIQALLDAACDYAERMRFPQRPFVPKTWKPIIQPDVLPAEEVESLNAGPEELKDNTEEFSDDEDEDVEPAPLTPKDAGKLLYKPLGTWAKFAELPIENPKLVYRLSGASFIIYYIRSLLKVM